MQDVGVPLKCSLKRTAPKQSADRKSKSMRAHAQGRRALSSQNGSPGGPLARLVLLHDPLEVSCRRLLSVTQRQHLLPTHTLQIFVPTSTPDNASEQNEDSRRLYSLLLVCMLSIRVRMVACRPYVSACCPCGGNAHARGPRASRTQTAACSLYRICMQEIKPQSLSHLLD